MNTPATEELTVTRLVRADRERVFATWTDPAMIVQWWGAGDVTCPGAEVDLRVGGTYRIANRTPDGQTMWITGAFRRVDPPHRLEYTWAMEPVTADSHYSIVKVAFDERPDGTHITVSQTQIVDRETREMHLQGWVGCLDGIERVLT